MDAMSCEEVLQGIGCLLEILIPRNLNHHVIVGIDEHLAVTDDFRLNLFDVLNGNLIVGIGNGGMTVLFLIQLHDFPFLVGKEDHLIIHQGINLGKRVDGRKQILGENTVSYLAFRIGTKHARQANLIHIQKAIGLDMVLSHTNFLAGDLEITHGNCGVLEIHGKETVCIPLAFFGLEKGTFHIADLQPVMDLLDFHQEVLPFGGIITVDGSFLTFSCNHQEGFMSYITPSMKEPEIRIRKETFGYRAYSLGSNAIHIKLLANENILLMKGITFPQKLQNRREQAYEIVIAIFGS